MLRTYQIRCLPRLIEQLKHHHGQFLEQLGSVAEMGGMALDLTADLQPITLQQTAKFGDQLLAGIARLPSGTAQITLQARFMVGGVDLFMGRGVFTSCITDLAMVDLGFACH